MEIQLSELITQIKKEGVQAAESRADEIISSANAEAEQIILKAKERAEKIIADAKAEAERTVKSGEDALRQAGRNLLISFRESVTKELDAIINENVSSAYSSEKFVELIVNAVEAFSKNCDAEGISVALSASQLNELEAAAMSALKEKLLSGVTLKAANIDKGFRIEKKGDGAYYDYSADEVTSMLSSYLSPKLTALLKEAE